MLSSMLSVPLQVMMIYVYALCFPLSAGVPAFSVDVRDFDWFETMFGRQYRTAAERSHRQVIFDSNLAIIKKHNTKPDQSFFLDVNEFADWTHEEFLMHNHNKVLVQRIQGQVASTVVTESAFHSLGNGAPIPLAIDYRNHSGKNCVTAVQTQGSCNGCWAFSAVASLESVRCVEGGPLVKLSEQELIDCYHNSFNQGCYGGFFSDPNIFFTRNGSCTEESYPYLEKNFNLTKPDPLWNRCKAATCKLAVKPGVAHEPVKFLPIMNETALLRAVAVQPVMTGIECFSDVFKFYKGGVLNSSDCGVSVDHAVLVIGYGSTEEGQDYWIIKNSWGTAWGEDGFARLARNVPDRSGMCGIATNPAYTVLNNATKSTFDVHDTFFV